MSLVPKAWSSILSGLIESMLACPGCSSLAKVTSGSHRNVGRTLRCHLAKWSVSRCDENESYGEIIRKILVLLLFLLLFLFLFRLCCCRRCCCCSWYGCLWVFDFIIVGLHEQEPGQSTKNNTQPYERNHHKTHDRCYYHSLCGFVCCSVLVSLLMVLGDVESAASWLGQHAVQTITDRCI